ncbi:AtpZ/AtpI family protein [Aliifodinibius salicampi]|uniref:AtpZ/AtpI family protein n=1 Tax=Fodinibius salicampi TaxID=1920655 RepID=A0ABT3PU80_9BACT|nr:AtpZ/AtpI family protein [Fodinibius salicampi]MCW9711416.1 AtpZ/AtpI family protein [Fodinibius salicampi]
MTEKSNNKNEFADTVRKKTTRKIRSREEGDKGLWYGLGMFGLVGWSVSIPTILFLLLGIWIDSTYKSTYSWTLMMLIVGIFIGCMNAWYWVKKESKGG